MTAIGGADGFGAAIVDRFSKEGCRVIFIDLNKDKGDLKAKADGNLHFLYGDVTRRETWEEALSCGKDMFERVDVVVNNAGITYDPSPVHMKPMEQYERIFHVNVTPIFLSVQVICPYMLEQGSGVFINITSTGCTRPRPGFAFYNASKAAVHIATKTMALEYAPTIRFNCICPAVGNTSMLQASIGNGAEAKEKMRKLEDMLPMGRVTEPVDIANAAWFLGSDQSSFVTGTTIEVDGGRGV
ncbi:uncharacterized protein Z518_05468 [Rhinocladiella mackenziei CBS 650.93]|uniref:Oxidoreductase n=1 Tax=Rhinocladiella mackenziei CBS 650.93 TaxID=1442369 RepID=A0A0D2H2F5_9EURO|nr:uncharacterized protein Z518_05468 [Rhinocladiella mackenziei CBS 650.93]KIX04598.1 hypothetical protein Z518_05468 [Rhinocladiella mackenziei CBS 650.93]